MCMKGRTRAKQDSWCHKCAWKWVQKSQLTGQDWRNNKKFEANKRENIKQGKNWGVYHVSLVIEKIYIYNIFDEWDIQ